ncbi:PREDICTED: probable aspartate aminotransferase, cytoplasmic [Papilio polytes]|uniref:probable aspartate aminotransferase, cytoplasmic n=1 Tax=Papilio polytes TaxID=76194 RepID=UPI00067638E8|nr:PREDICTED: probable aspartate aminotransferase, cytoplasmic [Papilio polytes]
MASRFAGVEQGPPIEVFQLNKRFIDDTFKNKVNLTIGAYRDENGKPWVLPVVRRTEKQMAEDDSLLHEYLPVLGLDQFTSASVSMLLGEDNPVIAEGRAFGVQTLSGTGGLRVGAEFLNKHLKYTTFYYSDPTWGKWNLLLLLLEVHSYTARWLLKSRKSLWLFKCGSKFLTFCK